MIRVVSIYRAQNTILYTELQFSRHKFGQTSYSRHQNLRLTEGVFRNLFGEKRPWHIESANDACFNVPCCIPLFKGLRPVLERFVVTMHEGACETGSQIEGVSPRDLTYCSHKPECIVTTNPDRSVLITIITWHFQFRRVNVSILHLKYDYRARSESRFACYSHCYVTWYPLTTGIVASQCPSARDAVLVTRYLKPIISACLNSILRFLPQ